MKATVSDEKDQKSDFTTRATISAFDANLNKLDVEINPGEVEVAVPVSKIGKTVPLRFQQSGNPADKTVTITSITSEDEKVTVIAPESVTNKIEQITIPIDVTQITTDKTLEVSVPVPTGATSITPTSVKVKITTGKKQSDQSSDGASGGAGQPTEKSPDVTPPDKDTEADKQPEEDKKSEQDDKDDVAKQTSTEFTDIPISIVGLVNSESFNTTFVNPINGKVSITISGAQQDMDSLGRNDFNIIASMSNLQEGTHVIPLVVHGLPSKFTFTLSQSKAEIQVTKKVADASNQASN